MIQAYFFDWMSTLADAEERRPTREILTEREHHSLLVNKFEKAKISEEYRDLIYSKLLNAKHWLYPDSEKIVNDLESNYKLAIVSNMYDITAKRVRGLFPNFLKKFDVVTLSCEVGLKKPDKEIFLYTLNKLNEFCKTNISVGEIVMIGDTQDKDIEPALKLGMQARIIDRNNHQKLEDIL